MKRGDFRSSIDPKPPFNEEIAQVKNGDLMTIEDEAQGFVEAIKWFGDLDFDNESIEPDYKLVDSVPHHQSLKVLTEKGSNPLPPFVSFVKGP
ncbi:hypothetical protein MTR_2g064305 [Medicago truncatula]|uniref:Uncharacterized protein n=1 Tax=Medicago truncatula TaxID=3880 RepID=A0A072V8T4_MEDTR|nr:hypothetical protein MTR_2g064305 [Medicago truncatula]